MDQRNAGASTAPVGAADGWATYTADQLALLDHLGVEECHVLGMCIGGPYLFGLLMSAHDRFRSAVLLQPVGIDDNRAAFTEMFDGWVDEIGPDHPEAGPDDWAAFRQNMWGGEFVLTATREQVAACRDAAPGHDGRRPLPPAVDVTRDRVPRAPEPRWSSAGRTTTSWPTPTRRSSGSSPSTARRGAAPARLARIRAPG